MFSNSKIAAYLSDANGPAGDPSLTLRQVRHFATRGLLSGGRQIDGRGAKAFPAPQVYAARVLETAAVELGAELGALEAIAAAFLGPVNISETPPSMLDVRTRDALGAAIRGVEAGEAWFVLVRRSVDLESGAHTWRAVITTDPTPFHAPEVEQGLALSSGRVVRAASIVSLKAAFAGLPSLAGLEAAE